MWRALLLTLGLAACGSGLPEEVTLTGRILAEPDADAAPLAGATLELRDNELAAIDEVETDDDGGFSLQLPAGYPFYLSIGGDGLVATSFSGYAGFEDYTVDDGVLWAQDDAGLTALRAEFADCATVDDPGGVVEGQVRLYIEGQEVEDLPTITTGEVLVYESDGTEHTACYLPDEEDPSAEQLWTGSTGRYAVFGIPEGPTTIAAWYSIQEDELSESAYYYAWMPEEGAVPLYPTLVSLL